MLFECNKRKYFFNENFLYLCVIKLELNPYILLIYVFYFVFDCNCNHPNDDERWQCQSSGRGVQTRHTIVIIFTSGRSEIRLLNVLAGRHRNDAYENQKELCVLQNAGDAFLKAEATGNVKMESRIIRMFSIIHKPGSHTWNSIQTNLMLPSNLRVLSYYR